ncbi:MAG: iron uptake porin [Microcoleaceae cyanobacterium]
MKNLTWNFIKQSSTVLGALFVMANSSLATDVNVKELNANQATIVLPLELAQVSDDIEIPAVSDLSEETMEQVTSVSQLSDVDPTAWAFQALQSLVERYGCIAGYPDGTFKGNRAMTRYEFAAGMNACLDRITELIATSTADLVTREDLLTLQKLQEEFATELATIRGRVDVLEARTAELENKQFSTTTKFDGEVVFFGAGVTGDRAVYPNDTKHSTDNDVEAYQGYRARLNFSSSFTGKDLLFTRLQVVNSPDLARSDLTNTPEARPAVFSGYSGSEANQFRIERLFYQFPIGSEDQGSVLIAANGFDLDGVGESVIPLFNNDGNGAVSFFGQRNPGTLRGPSNAALGLKYGFSDSWKVNLGYFAANPGNPREGYGVFNGAYSALAQLIFNPSDNFSVAVDYAHKYFPSNQVNLMAGTGSKLANNPFRKDYSNCKNGCGNNNYFGGSDNDGESTTSENVGLQMNWKISDGFQLGGWFGATWASSNSSDQDVTILNGAVTLAFPDLFKEGSLGGIVVGVPPMIVDSNDSNLEEDTPIHVEAFYRLQLNDYISLTPGFFVITNPNNNENNDAIWVGTFRTQFTF